MSAGALTGLCAATAGIVHHQRRGTDQTDESSSGQHSNHNPHSLPRTSGDKTGGSGISAAPSGDGMEILQSSEMDYNALADKVAEKALELYDAKDWILIRTASYSSDAGLDRQSSEVRDISGSGVLEECTIEDFKKEVKVMYKKSSEFEGHVYRAECTLDATPEKIIQYILPTSEHQLPKGLRGIWDKNVKASKVIERINDHLIIARSATYKAAMGLIASRDFVDLITVRNYENRGILATSSRSVERKDIPPKDDCVRGINYHGGTFCALIEGESNKSHVVNIVQSDLCGKLPQSLVESALPNNLIEFFVDLDKALKNEYSSTGV
ncbi:stAR-related lipid transfer protein 5-like [Lytechinus variegatus]|uniref:stAR-related lipid transfer protein 5-like n=1 Tax=Lytechinus variegatus TaxID=7654 RepID=UPI001BB1036F|nr:stAR-related lipid transfer protein 5-like [Lytechinus variegatus]XP_041464525.1 stAR-related lipid transfer protein 5-like [Lytechinus variegatus]